MLDINVQEKPTMGILLGDTAGVGPEIIAKLCAWNRIEKYCRFIIIGDSRVLEAAQKIARVSFEFNVVDDIDRANLDKGITLLDLKNIDPANIQMGQLDANSGKASGETLIKAVDLCKSGKIDGFTFAPFNKAALRYGGADFKDETRMISSHLGWTEPCGEINMLDNFWISRVTSHIPLKDVSANLNVQSILRAVKLAHKTLKLYGISAPRIALAAVNPHGGENGLYGSEEQELIIPAVKMLLEEGINAIGPIPSDILFVNAFNGLYDAVVTMYHDQGQIVMRLNSFQQGVTVLAGFPCGISKGAHGAGLDIAGKGIAKTGAVERAIQVGAKISSNIRRLRNCDNISTFKD